MKGSTTAMLAVIDYGAGNLRSVLHALRYLGIEHVRLVHHPSDLHDAHQIILPGVGAFGAGMEQLHKQDLGAPLKDAIGRGIPYLGICLGMQFLFEHSDEMGTHKGLGVIEGYVTRFPADMGLKVPHMGWNQLTTTRPSPLLANLSPESYAYFVHSYYCVPQRPEDVLITAQYGMSFCAGIQRDNIYAVQFHPEKSQSTGLRILSNFLKMTAPVA